MARRVAEMVKGRSKAATAPEAATSRNTAGNALARKYRRIK
jgi:lambda repressor-like predicted transcriptional regulator